MRRIRKRHGKKNIAWRSRTRWRLLLELFYFVLAALIISGGYTIAYFTSQDEVPPNTFTIGTVKVSAGGDDGGLVIVGGDSSSWTPGETKELELTITNTGSKRIYARARFEVDWKAQFHTNTATVTANYLPTDGSGVPAEIRRNTSVSYSYGDYIEDEEPGPPPAPPPHWFTGYDETSPLRFISASIVEQTQGRSSISSATGSTGDVTFLNGGKSTPTVNGLFYGDGDYMLYSPIATVPSGTTMYAFLDEQADGTRILYVALVVSRAVNDNVFDRHKTPYMQSAGWTPPHTFRQLTNSEYMAFELSGYNVQTGQKETWSWRQGYADWDAASSQWYSSPYGRNGQIGASGLPPGYTSSSSLAWNMNNSLWDVTVGGTRPNQDDWKSPFHPDYPDDVTKVDGYPPTGPITFSETYQWEWPMVYEFSVDMTNYNPYVLELHNIGSHHSPSKMGPEDEPFNGNFLVPGVSIIKEVSLDGGDTWHSSTPWPELSDPLPDNFAPRFRFTVRNSGSLELTDIVVTDDVLGVIGTLPALAPGESHSFPVYVDDDWESHRPEIEPRPDYVTFQLGEGMEDWVEGEDGYFYYTKPLMPGETVTLRVKVHIAEEMEDTYKYATIIINSWVEAVQASHNAVDVVWPGHPPLTVIPTGPYLRVTKEADRISAVAGDTINYTITVTNNGVVDLTGISVVDEMLGIYTTIDSLAPGASQALSGSYTVQPGDSGFLVNTATASTTYEGKFISAAGSVTVKVAPASPALLISKQADRGIADVGDTVNYTITVTNVGNVTLHDVFVADAMLGLYENIDTFAPGASAVYRGSYRVQEADRPGPLVNTAVAIAIYKGEEVRAVASASVDLIPPRAFSDLNDGDYVLINGVLFQKIGNNQALLRGTAGTATQPVAIAQGQNYYLDFPASITTGSRLLNRDEAQRLPLSIRANGQDWWTSDMQNRNRRYYIDPVGAIQESGETSVHEIRPLLILRPDLTVVVGDGTAENPHVLIIP